METLDTTASEMAALAATRSAVYGCLSRLFLYPEGDSIPDLEVLTSELGRLLTQLPDRADGWASLAETISALGAAPAPDWPALYTALFDNCQGRPAVSLYEKDYGNGDAKAVWEEVIRYYEHFGLEFDVRVTNDWPDHLQTELEFMHYLTYLEATAEQGDGALRRAQGDFIVRHLGRWASRFAARVAAAADAGPYGHFASIAAEFVEADMDYLGRSIEQTPSWIPPREAQTGLGGRTWIPIVEAAQHESLTSTESPDWY